MTDGEVTLPQYNEIEDAKDFKDNEILAVDRYGIPKEFIRPDALYSDKQAYWVFHQKKVLVGMAFCMIYFIIIIMG